MKNITVFSLATALCALAAAPVVAQEKGDMLLGLGVHYVSPKDSASTTTAGPVDVDGATSATITFEYFIADNIGIEVLAAWPFEHDINLGGAGKIGSAKHLPPTVSLQYHFSNSSKFTPFVGAGLNYTTFFDESTSGALSGASLSLDDSWGLALHAGLDYEISERGSLRADVRWIDIDTEAKVNGTSIGDVNIDPWIFGAAYVFKF
ncbi:OmpW family protein [Roseovarius sp. EL26]|uniref:OmpW/AlkL family protein n=1 Tax=Roseovarius sp. EL26 TaxID=2126672 RepID=UPI000EA3D3E2|nr:OmpW family outer membrane protein [Roseovarius sp. EL26]